MEGVTRDQLCAAAVEVISEQGMPQMGEVNTDLMCASCLETQAEECMCTVCLLCLVMCARRLTVGCNMPQNNARQGARDRRINAPFLRREHSFD